MIARDYDTTRVIDIVIDRDHVKTRGNRIAKDKPRDIVIARDYDTTRVIVIVRDYDKTRGIEIVIDRDHVKTSGIWDC